MGRKAGQNPSLLKNRIVSAEELFTDREEPRKAFWDKYDALNPGEFDVISFYGIGGVGKTSLLKKIGREMEEKLKNGKLDYVYFSFESEPTKEEFLYALSRKMMLRMKNINFPLMDTAIARIAEDGDYKLQSLEEKGRNIFDTEGADIIATAIGEVLPYAETAKNTINGIVKLSNKLKSEWEKENGDNKTYYRNISINDGKHAIENLSLYFRLDAEEILGKRTTPLVIMLDGYEHFANRVKDGERANLIDSWFYAPFTGILDLPNVMWVITGRNSLHWPEGVLLKDDTHRIGDLSEVDAKRYFNKAGIYDENLISGLYELTHGTPAFLDLCVETYNLISLRKMPELADFGNDTQKLAMRYLDNMDSQKQAILRMLSCFPNVWKMQMAIEIAEKLNYGNIKLVLDDLLPLSIFDKYPEGYRLHETVRDVIRKNMDNSEEVDNEILNYIKSKLLSDDQCEERHLINQFCQYLEKDTKSQVSSEEMYNIIDILWNQTELYADYSFGECCINLMINYSEKNNHQPQTIVKEYNFKIYVLLEMGLFDDCLNYATRNFMFAIKSLEENHPDTLTTLYNLSSVYFTLGKYEEALDIGKKCYDICVKKYSKTHPAAFSKLRNLGNYYIALGLYEEALDSFNECYELTKDYFGEKDINTIEIYEEIGVVLSDLGQYEESLSIINYSYQMYKDILGEKHPNTLFSLNLLGEVNKDLGRYKESLSLFNLCYELRKEIFGEKHPLTIFTFYDLGLTYSNLGMHKKALDILDECYRLRKLILGEKHPDTLSVLNSLGDLYRDLGQYKKSLDTLNQCYCLRKETLGEHHRDTLATLNGLGNTYLILDKIQRGI